jgi:predicted nucleotidyltransferase component of viral defense system
MISSARILEAAKAQDLLATTVEKDYVLGWMLYGIASCQELADWVFKGGTCLKKCYFETYRFSEDLDFTIPNDAGINDEGISASLSSVTKWVEQQSGVRFPEDGVTVECYLNKRGKRSFQARTTYVGPLTMQRRQAQRVKFDLTQDELLVDGVDKRRVVHSYGDALVPAPLISCYSINEVLAEKTRALYERQGRARDVRRAIEPDLHGNRHPRQGTADR